VAKEPEVIAQQPEEASPEKQEDPSPET